MRIKLLRYLLLLDATVLFLLGALECLLGLVYLWEGTVTFQQAGVGIALAGLMALAYVALYPRKPRLVAEKSAPPSQ